MDSQTVSSWEFWPHLNKVSAKPWQRKPCVVGAGPHYLTGLYAGAGQHRAWPIQCEGAALWCTAPVMSQIMASGRPGMLMRKRLLALLQEHGKTEVHGWPRTLPTYQEI